jgi:hypothetical protein
MHAPCTFGDGQADVIIVTVPITASPSAMALYRPGAFCGSNAALFVGQTIGDIYLSDFFVPPPPNFEDPPGSGNLIHIRLTSAVYYTGFTHFSLEISTGGAGNPNAIWNPAPPWIQTQLLVEDHGTLQHPVG